ncbi:MAG: RHS repeat domain-containing protein [Bacteroidota bacterium]
MFSIYEKSTTSGRHFTTVGGNRKPNSDFMDIGVLNTITYPTGGSTAYYFEPHDFILDGEKEIGGGLRIATIIKKDGKGSDITYRYRYTKSKTDNTSSGKIVTLPMYALASRSFDYSQLSEFEYKTEFQTFSYSISELGRTAGSKVGYTNVIEYKSNTKNSFPNGYTQYQYSFPAAFAEFNDRLAAKPGENNYPNFGNCEVEENGICDDLYTSTSIHNFFLSGESRSRAEWEGLTDNYLTGPTAPNPNYDWNRGLLLNKSVYASNDNIQIEHEYQYKNYYPSNTNQPSKIYGIRLAECQSFNDLLDDPGNIYPFRVMKYEINTDVAKVLTAVKKTIFDPEDASDKVVTTTAYQYEGNSHTYATQISQDIGSGRKQIKALKYPFDYNSAPAATGIISQMKSKRINTTPIEEFQYVESDNGHIDFMGAVLNEFTLNQGKILPHKTYELFKIYNNETNFQQSYLHPVTDNIVKDSRFLEELIINEYDDNGNILELENKQTGMVTSYIWGYNKRYLLAKIENITYAQVSSQVSNLQSKSNLDDDNCTDSGSCNEKDLRTALNALRNLVPQAMVTTYTYDPLIGITSITDPRGNTSYYQYDNLNRLQAVRDQQGRLLTDYEYHYKNQGNN